MRLLFGAELVEKGLERTGRRPAILWTVKSIPGPADLAAISRRAGTIGGGDRQRERYKRERKAFRKHLEACNV
jgi:hypothetical protein